MSEKTKIIIDFEFTGLDNTFIKDNEIIQMKVLNLNSLVSISANYGSTKNISAYGQIAHKVLNYGGIKFSKDKFALHVRLVSGNTYSGEEEYYNMDSFEFIGFSPSQDILMLKKYGIDIKITDIREQMQLTKHELRMATEGSSLECCYLIATGKYPELKSHDGVDELRIIHELYQEVEKLEKNHTLTVMPHGHCAGMELTQYVDEYRRQADGYRWNNHDLLAESLNAMIIDFEYDQFDNEDD